MKFRQQYDFSSVLLLCLILTNLSSANVFNTTSRLRGTSTPESSFITTVEHPFSLSCGTHRSSLDDEEDDADLISYIHSRERQLNLEQVTIPVCFHILTDDNGVNDLSSEQLQNQLDVLNRAYSSASCCDSTMEWCSTQSCSVETGFRFAWAQMEASRQNVIQGATVSHTSDACIIAHKKRNWTRFLGFWDPRLRQMKRRLRKGDATTLNVYWTDFMILKIAGYSTFPSTYWRKPKLDGVVMRVGVCVGGSITEYSKGAMLAHEVGHWLGLYHTFEEGCSERSDRIDDTPRELEAFRGCGQIDGFPLNRDSCPNDEGKDPIHNYMDYAYDECKFEFTQGQVWRMQASYERYRKGK
ncbi:hypothetical protein FisN_19Lu007 [Fistulifera solaris]|uniref:Peptidase M43 pregnancy-associated plasma-A domain-containing protein n=1 Tax=Fistulifera solaris TaxID=1519565 RepID=A0A1Z5JQX9_FISSO|nr:hypothetical protein FisN_19Lu007 [Fistulifera solaris]|eukprot:GAX16430.1 hypothetical protein FisN_19Lu007 [Fistulifera solaris]